MLKTKFGQYCSSGLEVSAVKLAFKEHSHTHTVTDTSQQKKVNPGS